MASGITNEDARIARVGGRHIDPREGSPRRESCDRTLPGDAVVGGLEDLPAAAARALTQCHDDDSIADDGGHAIDDGGLIDWRGTPTAVSGHRSDGWRCLSSRRVLSADLPRHGRRGERGHCGDARDPGDLESQREPQHLPASMALASDLVEDWPDERAGETRPDAECMRRTSGGTEGSMETHVAGFYGDPQAMGGLGARQALDVPVVQDRSMDGLQVRDDVLAERPRLRPGPLDQVVLPLCASKLAFAMPMPGSEGLQRRPADVAQHRGAGGARVGPAGAGDEEAKHPQIGGVHSVLRQGLVAEERHCDVLSLARVGEIEVLEQRDLCGPKNRRGQAVELRRLLVRIETVACGHELVAPATSASPRLMTKSESQPPVDARPGRRP